MNKKEKKDKQQIKICYFSSSLFVVVLIYQKNKMKQQNEN